MINNILQTKQDDQPGKDRDAETRKRVYTCYMPCHNVSVHALSEYVCNLFLCVVSGANLGQGGFRGKEKERLAS